MTNLNIYVRSLSLSDLLCCVVSLPLLCIEILFDVFKSGWQCRVVRYLNFIFPFITINNLVVISLEKHLSTRTVPRTFSFSAVRKMIICAWVLGLVISLFPTVAYDGIRLDLISTHFTVVCKYRKNFYPVGAGLIFYPIQYVLPSIFITYTNVCLLKTVWNRGRRGIGNVTDNAFKAHLRARRTKGTALLVAFTFAFILPYFGFIAYRMCIKIAKPQRDFSDDYLVNYSAAGIAYCIGALNFIIYSAQMKEFRVFLKKHFCRRNNKINPSEVVN